MMFIGQRGKELSPNDVSKVQALVSGARNKPKLSAIGDSLTAMTYQQMVQTAAVRASNILTVTKSSHGLFAGAKVRQDGIDTFDATMRGTFTVLTAPDANNFTVSNPGPDGTLVLGTTPRFQNLQRMSNDGVLNWALILGNQSFDLLEVFATSGRRTVDMLQFVAPVIAAGAGYCWVLGGTNDIVLDGATAASVLVNLRAIHAALIAGGVRPIVVTIPPPIGTAYTTARAQAIARVNAGLRSDCKANGMTILADLAVALTDSVSATPGVAKTNYVVANDVHPTQRGAYYGGKRCASDIGAAVFRIDDRVANASDTQGFDASSANIFDAGPWLSAGTISAPVTGTQIGTGLVAERIGTCAGAATCPARADGIGYDATIVATPAAASDGCNIRTAGSTLAPRVVAGVAYVGSASVTYIGLSGSTIQYGYHYISGTVDGTSVAYISAALYPNDATPLDEDWAGVVRFPPFTISGAISAGTLYNTVNFTAAGSAVTMKVGRMSLRGPIA